jgi:hypothetical protein
MPDLIPDVSLGAARPWRFACYQETKPKDYTMDNADKTQPLYQAIATACEALSNNPSPEWAVRWRERLRDASKALPSGCGIDTGTTIRSEDSGYHQLVLEFSFHHMNDVGYYVGWTDHTLVVRPDLSDTGFTLEFGHESDPDHVCDDNFYDYLHDVFAAALTAEYNHG